MGETSSQNAGRYSGASFALLTKHGKERVIDPRFQEALGAGVVLVDSFDTDSLGTFTREVARQRLWSKMGRVGSPSGSKPQAAQPPSPK